MPSVRSITLLVAFVLLATASGCVELIGQRFAYWHDVQRDALHIMLFYDGVHDSGDDEHGEGAQQLAEFLDSGSILLLDWPFHVDMAALRRDADALAMEPAQRELLEMVFNQVKVESVGHYRDADGRIGGMQHIEIRQVSEFLRSVNENISQLILNETIDESNQRTVRTVSALREAAGQGHQWITLEGQLLRVEFPVHPFEWRQIKADAMEQLAQAESSTRRMIIQGLSSGVAGYDETGGRVQFMLGDDANATPLRFSIRPEQSYEPSLEPIVLEHVAQPLPGLWPVRGPASPLALELYRTYGPPEQVVLDTLNYVDVTMDRSPEQALQLVRAFVQQAQDHIHPPPPADIGDAETEIQVWKEWSRWMRQYPLDE